MRRRRSTIQLPLMTRPAVGASRDTGNRWEIRARSRSRANDTESGSNEIRPGDRVSARRAYQRTSNWQAGRANRGSAVTMNTTTYARHERTGSRKMGRGDTVSRARAELWRDTTYRTRRQTRTKLGGVRNRDDTRLLPAAHFTSLGRSGLPSYRTRPTKFPPLPGARERQRQVRRSDPAHRANSENCA